MLRILLVDDDEIIRKGMRKIIENNNLNCIVVGEAADGELALQQMEQCEKVDLLITDIRMPIMDGLELIKEVRKNHSMVKIIVLSGFDDFKYVRNAFMDGAVDYILKPINKLEFIELLQKIETSIQEDCIEENNRKESQGLLIANVLNKLFHGQINNTQEDIVALSKTGISMDKNYFVMITRIDQYYKQKLGRMEYEGQLERIYYNLEELFGYKSYQLFQYIDKVEIVSFIVSEHALEAAEISESFYQQMGKEEETTYTMGVSNVKRGLENAQAAYQEALDAVDTRFYLGKNHRIEYNQIKEKCIDMQFDLGPNVTQLAHYLELCDYVNSKHVMEKIFLELSYVKPFKFRKYMEDVIEMLFLRVKDFEYAVLCCDHDYKFSLMNVNTYNELKDYMNSILQNTIEYIRKQREKRSKKRIEMAKKYIQDHYMEAITLNDVADDVELNASYFSNLFKMELGINFSDYLMNTRMDMAKQLLRNPKIKVYEIGSMVGYEDAVSFGRAFKKKIGMSPKEYRNAVY